MTDDLPTAGPLGEAGARLRALEQDADGRVSCQLKLKLRPSQERELLGNNILDGGQAGVMFLGPLFWLALAVIVLVPVFFVVKTSSEFEFFRGQEFSLELKFCAWPALQVAMAQPCEAFHSLARFREQIGVFKLPKDANNQRLIEHQVQLHTIKIDGLTKGVTVVRTNSRVDCSFDRKTYWLPTKSLIDSDFFKAGWSGRWIGNIECNRKDSGILEGGRLAVTRLPVVGIEIGTIQQIQRLFGNLRAFRGSIGGATTDPYIRKADSVLSGDRIQRNQTDDERGYSGNEQQETREVLRLGPFPKPIIKALTLCFGGGCLWVGTALAGLSGSRTKNRSRRRWHRGGIAFLSLGISALCVGGLL
jgi:hypothetical protein